MEADGHKRMFTVCACEFLGTALFIFGILQTNLPLSIPFSLLASVVIWGDITGGHFNPAVTLGVFVTLGDYGKNFAFMIMIMIAQIAGGFLAIGMNWIGAYGKADSTVAILAPVDPKTGAPENPANDHDYNMEMNVAINEVFCTFIFISVILMVKGKHTAGDRVGVGAAMAVVVTLLCVISGTNKFGACFNPAVGIALPANSVLWLGKSPYLYHYVYIYTLGPALGGLLAGFFHLLHAPAHEPVQRYPAGFDGEHHEGLVNQK